MKGRCKMKTPDFTADFLRQVLDYNPLTGVFTWKVNRSRQAKRGVVAGREIIVPDDHHVRIIGVKRKNYYAHRLAWYWMTSEWPTKQIDHKDCNALNNAWNNLRLATPYQNSMNQRKRKNNKTGFKGVSFHKRDKRFAASIRINGNLTWLGYFDTAEEAHAAYMAAARKHFGEFARAA